MVDRGSACTYHGGSQGCEEWGDCVLSGYEWGVDAGEGDFIRFTRIILIANNFIQGELVYVDFKPKVVGQGNKTVEFSVSTCT